MSSARPLAYVLTAALGAGSVLAAPLPPGRAEAVGMSKERLERMHRTMQGYVDRGELSGLVTLVVREGRVIDHSAFGLQNIEQRQPMHRDTIFRIASMTKAVTSVAAMILYEEGKLLLTDPISKYLPAFKAPRVQPAPSPAGPLPAPVAADREITVRDLLTHRAGLTYGFIDAGAVGNAYRAAGVADGLTHTEGTIGENVARLAAVPLVSQPGKEFRYGLSDDVLGHLIEVVSGQSLDVFVRERILAPLRMSDTGFDVPEAKWARFAEAYTPGADGKLKPMSDPQAFEALIFSPTAYYRAPKKFFSGGAGMVSTAMDYARFLQMLLNGGELEGERILSPKTVDLIRASHTKDLPPGAVGGGKDFGLGFSVVTDLGGTQRLGSLGMYSWGGIYGTDFWIDPAERLIGILMLQRFPNRDLAAGHRFQVMTYQAIVR